jgi:hypothetical protein
MFNGQFHALAALPPWKESPVSIGRRLAGPQSRSGLCEIEINFFPMSGIEPLPPSPDPVTIPTELSILRCESIIAWLIPLQTEQTIIAVTF